MGGAIGIPGCVLAAQGIGEQFTKFHILGPGGKAEDYPTELKVGQEGTVIVGIVNHEHESASYKVEIWIGGEKAKLRVLGEDWDEVEVEMEHGRKWEQAVGFVAQRAGREGAVCIIHRLGAPFRSASPSLSRC